MHREVHESLEDLADTFERNLSNLEAACIPIEKELFTLDEVLQLCHDLFVTPLRTASVEVTNDE